MTVKGNISAYAWTKTRQIIMEKQVNNMSYCQVFPFPNSSFSPIPLLILYSFSIVYQKFGEKTKTTCFHKCWDAFHNSSLLKTFWTNIFSNLCRWRKNTNSKVIQSDQTSSPGGHDSPFKGSCCHHPKKVTNCRIARVCTLNFPLNTNIMTLKIDGWKMKCSY